MKRQILYDLSYMWNQKTNPKLINTDNRLLVARGREEKAIAPHSSTLAWKIPWTEEPFRLQSMGSLRVGHD